MKNLVEQDVENLSLALLEAKGYNCIYGPTIAPDSENPEREKFSDVVLVDRLKNAIDHMNPNVSESAKNDAIRKILNLPSQNLVENNEIFHKLLTDGVEVEYKYGYEIKDTKVWLVDFANPNNNEFVICNQVTVEHERKNRRPDIILFVNGLPLVVIELKNPLDEKATVKKAYTQLQNYKNEIPQLFYYNAILVASDGLDAKAGSLTAGWSRFMQWKTVSGNKITSKTVPQIDTMIKGMLRPDVLLDIIKNFTVFEKEELINRTTGIKTIETIKKVAAYHQYRAVNKAIQETMRATGFLDKENANGKVGVVWHTQGSGKSLSMVFYTGKTVKRFLRKYGYPPDKQTMAIDNVLEQAKLLADEWGND
jgi:type I restriction enzyme, R subunit